MIIKNIIKVKGKQKNSISEYVYNCIVEEDNKKSSSKNITNDKYDKYDKKDKNAIVRLNEYCQNKNNNLSINDIKYEYEINEEGMFNCIVHINGKTYKQNQSYKSKKEAKNEIAEYVYTYLTIEDINKKENNNIFSDKVKNILSENDISIEYNDVFTMKDDENKYICYVRLHKHDVLDYIDVEPKTMEELSDCFYEYLLEKCEKKANERKKEIKNSCLENYAKSKKIPLELKLYIGKKHIRYMYESLGIKLGECKEKIISNEIEEIKKRAKYTASEEALKIIKMFSEEKERYDEEKNNLYPPYCNIINLNIEPKIFNKEKFSEKELILNSYIQNVSQNFTSTSSKKEEKKITK